MCFEQEAGSEIFRDHRPQLAFIGIDRAVHAMAITPTSTIGIFVP